MTVFARWVPEDGRFDFSRTENGGVEITDEAHEALFSARAECKVIRPNAEGLPELQDMPGPSAEDLASMARTWRDGVVAETQWLIDRHRDEEEDQVNTTLSDAQYEQLRTYRRALRDWPANMSFPDIESRPLAPDWL